MTKRILDVGQCDLDHSSIRHLIEYGFENSQVDRADDLADTFEMLRTRAYDLVLINRKLDRDQSDGIEIIKSMKKDPQLSEVPVMLITNYAEHQQDAVAAGAEPGFGKNELDKPGTRDKLCRALENHD